MSEGWGTSPPNSERDLRCQVPTAWPQERFTNLPATDAYPSTAAVFGTYCGLRIDGDMRVIDVFGEPIDGLYAAGEVVGGFHGGAYMTGPALGKAVVFGRVAVRTACEGAAVAA
jgi:succinate dehydrogenase/fumarate reductase flavoprotein subunit